MGRFRGGMMLDPAAQQRLAKIRRYNELRGAEQMVDYRTHSRKQMEATQREVREILNDPYRTNNPRAQHDEAMRVAREGQQAHIAAVQEAMAAYDAEVERLERMANPPPQRGQRGPVQLLERQELLRMNERRWERGGGDAVLADYQRALRDGDDMMAELIEDFAGQHVKDPGRSQEFGDLVYEQKRSRLPASAQNALEQLEGLVRDEYIVKGGMALQKSTMAGFVKNVKNGQPVRTRDDVAGEQAARLAQVGGQ